MSARENLTLDKLRSAYAKVEAIGEVQTVAFRANYESLDALVRAYGRESIGSNGTFGGVFGAIRLHPDPTLGRGEYVPMTADEERRWLDGEFMPVRRAPTSPGEERPE